MNTDNSKQNNNKIIFDNKSKKYSFLSNFYISEINIDDKKYNHVEGYYQCSKYIGFDEKYAERIRHIYSPIVARKVSEEHSMDDNRKTQWKEGYKLIVMKRAILTKFITNQELAKSLLCTGSSELVFNTLDDNYWGCGSSNKGDNILGKILMETRDIIKNMPNDYE